MRQLVISQRLTNRDNASFKQYLKEISEIKEFGPHEEAICAEKANRGDRDAINELVSRNLRFVVSVAKQYANTQNSLEDLVNEGNIGFIMAAEKFNPNMGFKFISYAVWWVRKVIMEYIAKNGKLIRFPANKINVLSKLDKEIKEREQKLGRYISIYEIIDDLDKIDDDFKSKTLEKKTSELNHLDILNSYNMDSFDREISGDDGNTLTLLDLISDKSALEPPDFNIINEDIKKEIKENLFKLKPKERHVLIGLYGLNGDLPRTLKDIGDEIGVTREMIRQIREKALFKMRCYLINSKLNESLDESYYF